MTNSVAISDLSRSGCGIRRTGCCAAASASVRSTSMRTGPVRSIQATTTASAGSTRSRSPSKASTPGPWSIDGFATVEAANRCDVDDVAAYRVSAAPGPGGRRDRARRRRRRRSRRRAASSRPATADRPVVAGRATAATIVRTASAGRALPWRRRRVDVDEGEFDQGRVVVGPGSSPSVISTATRLVRRGRPRRSPPAPVATSPAAHPADVPSTHRWEDVVGARGDGDQRGARPADAPRRGTCRRRRVRPRRRLRPPVSAVAAPTVSWREPVSASVEHLDRSVRDHRPARAPIRLVSGATTTSSTPASSAASITRRTIPTLAMSDVWLAAATRRRMSLPASGLTMMPTAHEPRASGRQQRPGDDVADLRRDRCRRRAGSAARAPGVNGTGENGAPIRPTGASRWSNATSWICAAISAPRPPKRTASCTTMARLVLRTDSAMVSVSSGCSVRGSMTSQLDAVVGQRLGGGQRTRWPSGPTPRRVTSLPSRMIRGLAERDLVAPPRAPRRACRAGACA